ncbi:M20 aminoacylase family protein [Enterovirga rhinocerotis]|uniref:Hippurate hydrolase n=1 Tax=Enterovirga rhinocerotis TaxID=1339210 RepID=A0A4R7C5B5_9HYPH|nr:M20 aminoacylase family protein [Enterovirga rhinocerotis]TDR93361.1 hippurate hydrolase [Enterovirga rhinocerotis]
MSVIPRIADLAPEIAAWRQDFHAHPELLYEVHRTAGLVADRLREFGCDEVVTGIGRTGVVGVIKGKGSASGKVVGLRADMDALPIEEATNLPYRSTHPGLMHACGHDGHTAMLLGAAKYLAETRDFDGTAVIIFQPAEEGGAGGEAMVKDGLMERFGIQEVYGMHNWPGVPVGEFAIRRGPIMAAADRFVIEIEGRGGHAAQPNRNIDTLLCASQVVVALQAIVARNVDPLDSAVLSVCSFKAGETYNVMPQQAQLMGTVRTLKPETRDLMEARLKAVVASTAEAFGASATIDYRRGYPVTFNHAAEADAMAEVARTVGRSVRTDIPPEMGAEDFSFMLEKRPGAYIFMGNGESAACHHPAYNFDDTAIPYGASLWARLIETRMPAA